MSTPVYWYGNVDKQYNEKGGYNREVVQYIECMGKGQGSIWNLSSI